MLALASCSQDELTSVNRDGDEIAFSVVTNKGTRAADVYCNNNLPGSFKVWASLTNGSTTSGYMGGDEITYTTEGKWVNSGGTRYWPNDGALSFYAITGGSNLTIEEGGKKITNYTVKTNVSEQEDILYAAALNKTKAQDGNSPVTMNFRHAMSQIVFKAKNINPRLYVKVSEVRVCHLANSGSFTFNQSTEAPFVDHEGVNTNSNATGSWGTALSGNANYGVTLTTPVALPGSKEANAVALTYVSDGDQQSYTNSMLLMPQTKSKWATDNTAGFYFAVKCVIYNVLGDNFNETSDVAIWGTAENHKYVVIPAQITWTPGKKYIYTFVFGEGNGGYKPDDPNPDPDQPDPDPTNPEPVLVPITFDVSVDDFDVVTPDDITAEAGE